jgi:hypothetical protein
MNYSYNGQTYILEIPGYTAGSFIAYTLDKLWAISTQIDEWDITENPFLATFNRTIALPGGFTTSSGTVALDNTTLIAVNDTPAPQKVVELDITGLTASVTNQFDLQASRTAIGNPLYTIDGKLIIINQDTISSDYYLSQYDYATGALEVDFNMGSFAAVGMYYCNCNIYLIDANVKVNVLINVSPDVAGFTLSQISPSNPSAGLDSFSQYMGCMVKSLTGNPLLTTTTSTTLATYCYSVDISGEGNLLWVNSSGQQQFYPNGPSDITTLNVCAAYNSFSKTGDLVFNFCTDYTPCSSDGDCTTTTTTTTSP